MKFKKNKKYYFILATCWGTLLSKYDKFRAKKKSSKSSASGAFFPQKSSV